MIRKIVLLALVLSMIEQASAVAGEVYQNFLTKLRAVHFPNEKSDGHSTNMEVHVSPRVEYQSDKVSAAVSADIRARFPDNDAYKKTIQLHRKNGEKPTVLLQEAYVEKQWDQYGITAGRFKPRSQIEFDFFRLDPFASLDYSEPFLALDEDRLLGNWGAKFAHDWGGVTFEIVTILHEDPIVATHEKDVWTRPLPMGLEYGSFRSDQSVDLGIRASGQWWELAVFHGSSNNASFYELDGSRLHLVYPGQTSIEGAVELPLGMFNLRLGALHNWRRWMGMNAGQFMNVIGELEFIKENAFRKGDNLFFDLGFSNVWNTGESQLFQDNLGFDQIYRGGSVLLSAEYSPTEDWVFKFRTIYNLKHQSSFFSPEVVKAFYTSWGGVDLYLKAMFISGSSDDIISQYSNNDNVELGIRFIY